MAGPWEVPELKIRERPPSTLRNVDGGPSKGAGAEDPGAQRAPREVPELKIWEHPSSTLRNINDERPGCGPHPGFKRCVVNLHRHDRQKVILLTGPILSHLVLLWLMTLSQLTGQG
jgi:hypothetical protein